MYRNVISYAVFTVISFSISAQNQEQEKLIQKLSKTITNAKSDSVAVKAYFEWDDLIWMTDPALDFKINLLVDSICGKNLIKKSTAKETYFFFYHKAKALNNLGSIYFDKGKYSDAVRCHTESLKIRRSIKDLDGISSSLNNLGNVYLNQGNYEQAIIYYTKSLNQFEKTGNERGAATALNNIGTIYKELGEFQKALEYHRRSLKIRKAETDVEGVSNSLNNIATVYQAQGLYKKAIPIFQQSIKLSESIENRKGLQLH